jgi:hypothetical protein
VPFLSPFLAFQAVFPPVDDIFICSLAIFLRWTGRLRSALGGEVRMPSKEKLETTLREMLDVKRAAESR